MEKDPARSIVPVCKAGERQHERTQCPEQGRDRARKSSASASASAKRARIRAKDPRRG